MFRAACSFRAIGEESVPQIMFRITTIGAGSLLLLAANAEGAPDNAIRIGAGTHVAPALTVELRHDDNILRSEANERSSMIARIANQIAVETTRDGARAGLRYSGDYARYLDSREDDYDDHVVRAELGYEGSRSRFEFYGSYSRLTQARGTGVTDGLDEATLRERFPAPVELERWDFGAEVTLGAPTSRSDLTLSYDRSERTHLNFREFTRDRDRRENEFGAAVRYALTGNTDARIELSRRVVDYDFTPPGALLLDSTEDRVVGGLAWQATALTRATALVGWKEKRFDEPLREDVDGLTWEVIVDWEPLPFSRLRLFTLNEFVEADTQGSTRDVTRAGLSWNHDWTERLRTGTAVTYTRDKFEGADRTDEFLQLELDSAYDLLRWLTLAAGVRVSSRSSDRLAAEFDRTIVFFRIELEPDFGDRRR